MQRYFKKDMLKLQLIAILKIVVYNNTTRCDKMNCTTTCNNCNKCDDKCPYCGYKGKEVKLETVAELTKNKCVFFENGEKIYICTNKKCDLVYFQVGNPKVYLKEEIKVPVWFKENIRII